MLVARAVVDDRFSLDGLLGDIEIDLQGSGRAVRSCLGEHGDFKCGQRPAGVAIAFGGPEVDRFVGDFDFQSP